MKDLTIRLSSSKADRRLANWLTAQANPAEAAKQMLIRALNGASQRDAEVATLQGQVQSLIAILDRLTAAGLGEQAAVATRLADAAASHNGHSQPAALSRLSDGPRAGAGASSARRHGSRATAGVAAGATAADPVAQVDAKLSKVLDFGDF